MYLILLNFLHYLNINGRNNLTNEHIAHLWLRKLNVALTSITQFPATITRLNIACRVDLSIARLPLCKLNAMYTNITQFPITITDLYISGNLNLTYEYISYLLIRYSYIVEFFLYIFSFNFVTEIINN